MEMPSRIIATQKRAKTHANNFEGMSLFPVDIQNLVQSTFR